MGRPIIATEWVRERRHKGKPCVITPYCPWCGQRYEAETADASEPTGTQEPQVTPNDQRHRPVRRLTFGEHA